MQWAKRHVVTRLTIFLALLVTLSLSAPTSMWASPKQGVGNQASLLHRTLNAHSFTYQPEHETLDYVQNELLVKFDKATAFSVQAGKPKAGSPNLEQAFDCFGLTAASEVLPGTYKLSGRDVDVQAAAKAMQAAGGVSFAVPNYIRHVMLTPNDEQYASQQQWGVTQVKAEQAWDITTGSDGIIIAIVDTGTAGDHPDLQGKVIGGRNFVNDTDNASDDFGHGTYTAGIAAAASNNGQGIVGISWGAKIMPVKVLNDRGSGSDEVIARGIHWAVDNGARIINASLGGREDTPILHEAAQYAHDHNILLVASAGNTPDGKPSYPAAYDTALAVGATGRSDTYTGFSSFGGYVGVSAPGVGILSTSWEDGKLDYEYGNGTSASAPFVSGIAALIWSVNPGLTADQVKQIIEDTSDDLGDPGRDEHYGYGRVNALRAVQMAQQGPPAPHTPTPSGQATNTPMPASTKAPSSGPAIQVNNPNMAPGALLTIAGAGFGSNEVVDLQITVAGGQPNSIGNVQTGPQGEFRAEVALPGNVPPGKLTLTAVGGTSSLRASVDLNVTSSGPRPVAFNRVGAIANSPTQAYFVPVGHTLKGSFLKFWQTHGGLAIFGYPISEEFAEVNKTDGKTYAVQYFERNRFEYHPEFAGTPNDVLMGLLGVDLTRGRNFPPGATFQGDANNAYFSQTAHSLSGPFLKYWKAHGGLAIFGYPISEPLTESGYTVQYFERNRFEYHPEFAGTPNDVLLGLLGVETVRRSGWLQ